MPLLLILGLVAAGIMLLGKKAEGTLVSLDFSENNPTRFKDLPDINPAYQGGSFKKDFDTVFSRVADVTGIPFALLKAHAIMESSLKPNAIRNEPATSKRPPSASYGLMQILWWKQSNRFAMWGYDDDFVGDGSILFDPDINVEIGAEIIKDNLQRLSLRDAVNAYNTGVAENVRVAPLGYTDKVLGYYSTLIGRQIV